MILFKKEKEAKSSKVGKNQQEEKNPLIKNVAQTEKKKDFELDAVGLAGLGFLVLFVLIGRFYYGYVPTLPDLGILIGTPLVASFIMSLLPRWSTAVKFLLFLGLLLAIGRVEEGGLALGFGAFAVLFAPTVQKMEEWERAIVLRFGKFHRVRGPG
ncbi:MAG: hypothetical protein SNJ78_08945, partial [Spirochaetales bacterium]